MNRSMSEDKSDQEDAYVILVDDVPVKYTGTLKEAKQACQEFVYVLTRPNPLFHYSVDKNGEYRVYRRRRFCIISYDELISCVKFMKIKRYTVNINGRRV